jgi:hypothetical protein
MKRAAYVSSWIALVLYGAAAVAAFVTGMTALRYSLIAVAIIGLTLVAFHANQLRMLPIVAAVLNGVFALLVFIMVASGLDFAVGSGAFLTAGVFLVLFFVPALLNTIAMWSVFRMRSQG